MRATFAILFDAVTITRQNPTGTSKQLKRNKTRKTKTGRRKEREKERAKGEKEIAEGTQMWNRRVALFTDAISRRAFSLDTVRQ